MTYLCDARTLSYKESASDEPYLFFIPFSHTSLYICVQFTNGATRIFCDSSVLPPLWWVVKHALAHANKHCEGESGEIKKEKERKREGRRRRKSQQKKQFLAVGIWTHGLYLQSRAFQPIDLSSLSNFFTNFLSQFKGGFVSCLHWLWWRPRYLRIRSLWVPSFERSPPTVFLRPFLNQPLNSSSRSVSSSNPDSLVSCSHFWAWIVLSHFLEFDPSLARRGLGAA